MRALWRHACSAKAQAVARFTPLRLDATLLAFARHMEVQEIDDALDLFDQLGAKRLSTAQRSRRAARLGTLRVLDRAATDLRTAVKLLLTSETASLDDS